jgi:hypothetical protein
LHQQRNKKWRAYPIYGKTGRNSELLQFNFIKLGLKEYGLLSPSCGEIETETD